MTVPILSIRDPGAVALAAQLIQAGKLVIIPTDTIYGIATLLELEQTIDRLYSIRGRKPEPALPLLIAASELINKYALPNQVALQLAQHFWPGPLTLILPPAAGSTPVALRMPNFPLLEPLSQKVGGCLFTSGAILSGQSPAITAREAAAFFEDYVDLILDGGPAPYGLPSTIIDCTQLPPLLVRHGAANEEAIREVLGGDVLETLQLKH